MKKISELLAPLFVKTKEHQEQLPDNDITDLSIQENKPSRRMCIYVKPETHNMIKEIVNIIPNKKLTVGGLVDSILMEYLIANKDEINRMYRQDRDDLIKDKTL